MAKIKPPKVKNKQELKDWLRSVNKKNVDKVALKDAHKSLRAYKKE